jgi:hypothetical protein
MYLDVKIPHVKEDVKEWRRVFQDKVKTNGEKYGLLVRDGAAKGQRQPGCRGGQQT